MEVEHYRIIDAAIHAGLVDHILTKEFTNSSAPKSITFCL
jgi:hypothetical protein